VPTEEIVALNHGILRPDVRIRLLAEPEILASRLAARPAEPSRRFERLPDASERELELYADADRLLRGSCPLSGCRRTSVTVPV
jgi:hypothetical protein